MSLAQRSLRSSSYTIASSVFQAAIQFVRSILLARLLMPEHFGVYTYAASFVMLTAAVPSFGMGAAILHRARESEGEIAWRVHFTLNLVFNLLWGILLILTCSWFVQAEYRWVFWVILMARVFVNLTATARAKLTRNVTLRRSALLEGINTLFGSIIVLVLAWRGLGLWSLVSSDIVAAVVSVLGYYVIRPVWRPRFGWSREVAKYLLNFGSRSVSASLLLQALDRVDDLWVGTFLGDASLGYYSRAYTFATYPRKILANPLNRVVAGTYAALKGQPKRLSQAFFRVNAVMIRGGFLFAGLLFLLIPEFIHLVIGDKWLPMLVPFRLMLVYTLLDPIKITIGSVFTAVGEPEKVVRARFWQLLVLLVGLVTLGPLGGINGVAFAVDIMLIFGIIQLLWQVRIHVKVSIRALFLVPLVGLGTGLSFALSWQYLNHPILFSWISATQKTIIFLVGFGGVLWLFERDYLYQWIAMAKKMMIGEPIH